MIKSLDYNHKLYEIAKEGELNGWVLKKNLESENLCIRYFPDYGSHYLAKVEGDFPVVTLSFKGAETMTSDVREHDSYKPVVESCGGKILMVGLGVGLLPSLVWDKLGSKVTHMDIVEVEQDVIDLVGKYINHPAISLIQGDAWKYPGTCKKTYDFIFIDIWNSNAEAIAAGPGLVESYRRLLNPGGEVRYWLQELGQSLENQRGDLEPHRTNTPCKLCGGGWFQGHSNLYGGLCLQCARDFEFYLYGDGEVHANGDLSETLKSLGYRTLAPHKLLNGKEIDILVESNGKKYLVEGKRDLTTKGEFDRLLGQIQQYSTLRRQGFSGLKLVIYGDVDHNLYIDLKKAIVSTYRAWIVDLVFKGRLV